MPTIPNILNINSINRFGGLSLAKYITYKNS